MTNCSRTLDWWAESEYADACRACGQPAGTHPTRAAQSAPVVECSYCGDELELGRWGWADLAGDLWCPSQEGHSPVELPVEEI